VVAWVLVFPFILQFPSAMGPVYPVLGPRNDQASTPMRRHPKGELFLHVDRGCSQAVRRGLA
ncbi:MAG TPA: hypothetical protein PLJ27_22890, partial [Polyangiaceae bacterium]|nr:hypothetical protein [Polyangiaceae bacterium]